VFVDPGEGIISLSDTVNGDFYEGAIYFSRQTFNVAAGGGYLESKDDGIITFFGFPITTESTVTHGNAWGYANISLFENLNLTLGASMDWLRLPFIDRHPFNPKLGISWKVFPGTVFRAAYFETLKRTTVGGQTIEPTQIAGFNQLFDDKAGTEAKRWGVGVDQKISNRLFAGFEWSQRELEVPIAGVGLQNWTEALASPYLNWIANDRIAVNLALQWERFDRDAEANNDQIFSVLDVVRVPLELRYYDPSGMFALLRTTFVRESGRFRNFDLEVFKGHDAFAVVDAGLGWRFPGRGLVGTIQVKNLFDRKFAFQDTDAANPVIVPRRIVVGRVTLSF
jgi:outer membrane receptor protein involved in Fe transport